MGDENAAGGGQTEDEEEDVGGGQVEQVKVGDSHHGATAHQHVDDDGVAADTDDEDESERDRHEDLFARRRLIAQVVLEVVPQPRRVDAGERVAHVPRGRRGLET